MRQRAHTISTSRSRVARHVASSPLAVPEPMIKNGNGHSNGNGNGNGHAKDEKAGAITTATEGAAHPSYQFGPIGLDVYQRTYSRLKADGTHETWPETVRRVVDGNLALVDEKYHEPGEREKLYGLLLRMDMIPAGRHLWATGVPGRQYLANCHSAGFSRKDLTLHFIFSFDELMKGGGVGSNYSNKYIGMYPPVFSKVELHIVCNPSHPNIEEFKRHLSKKYDHLTRDRYVVDDSREGWCGSLAEVLKGAWDGRDMPLVIDITPLRERGALLKSFGGVSSGPTPLLEMLIRVNGILNSKVGQKLSSTDMMQIDHEIATCVVSGNIRRCLPEEMPVHTREGLIKIKDVTVGDEVMTSHGEYRRVSAVFPQGVQQTVRIVTQMGEFECTPNHRMAVLSDVEGNYCWVEASNLKPGDRLVFVPNVLEGTKTSFPEWSYQKPKNSTTCKDITVPELDADAAWLLGFFCGDGYVYPNFEENGFNAHVSFALGENDPVDRVRREVERWGVNVIDNSSKDEKCIKLWAQSKQLAWYFSKFKEAKKSIVVPDFIGRGLPEVRAGFLAGLMDADGAAGNRPVLLVATIYKSFAKEVQALYASLGIPTRLKLNREADGSWQEMWHVVLVGRRSFRDFTDRVGPFLAKHPAERVKAHAGYGFSNEMVKAELPNKSWKTHWDGTGQMNHDVFEDVYGETDFIPIEVVGLTDGRNVETYDIEVEGKNEFVAGGLLVHNSARMSLKYWADPDIFDFINCKKIDGDGDEKKHWSTNVSVEVDDAFFRALRKRDHHAERVLRIVSERMHKDGEPGFWNSSLSAVGEGEYPFTTNPCGEIAMPPWDVCNLGHINLERFAGRDSDAREAFRLMTRFLLRATFGDIASPQQKEVISKNRRIGVGFFGFHSWLIYQGVRFSESHHNKEIRNRLRSFYDICRKEAREYSFKLRIPEPIKVTCVAPTGTISNLPGTMSGCQPIFARHFLRRMNLADNDKNVAKYRREGYPLEKSIYTKATLVVSFPCKDPLVASCEKRSVDTALIEEQSEISISDHLAVQAMLQNEFADNCISYTINFDPKKVTVRELREALRVHLPHLKGTTVMPELSGRKQLPFEKITEEYFEKERARGLGKVSDAEKECRGGSCPIK